MTTTSETTICAISTPQGTGGIAVIRISGPQAISITDTIWQGKPLAGAQSHTAHLGNIIDPQQPPRDRILDQAVATVFRAPHSYTGDDTVELSIHGSRWIQQQLINLLIRQGCTPAAPGEFTRRAFAAGNIDLAQAEAIADIIASSSRAAHRIAISQMRGHVSRQLNDLRQQLIELTSLLELELDFSDQDVEFADRNRLTALATDIHNRLSSLADTFNRGAAIKEGIPIAIIGPTNAGKSTLLNTLLGEQRAIVSDIHGTTRDTIEDTIELGDYLFRIIDTAGIRQTSDAIEQLGIERTLQASTNARHILLVLDPNDPETPNALTTDIIPHLNNITHPYHLHILLNKADTIGTKPANTPATATSGNSAIQTDHNHPTAPETILTSLSNITQPYTIHTISARHNTGIDQLITAITSAQASDTDTSDQNQTIITNARHYQALRDTATALSEVIQSLNLSLPGDLIAQPLRIAIHHLGTITGTITTPDILTTIFTRFCIGK